MKKRMAARAVDQNNRQPLRLQNMKEVGAMGRKGFRAAILLTAALICLRPAAVFSAGGTLETAAAPPTESVRPTSAPKETTAPAKTSSTSSETKSANKKDQKISAKDVVKTIGAAAFSLKAKVTSGKASDRGALSYSSGNKKVATVDSKGKVTLHSVGKAQITITAKATKTYRKTTKKITVTVNPKGTSITQIRALAGKTLTVTIKKQPDVSGYELRCSTKASMKNATTVRAAGAGYVSKSIRNLKVGKKYYIQVRTYKTVKGTDYFSTWSKAKSGVPKSPKTGY